MYVISKRRIVSELSDNIKKLRSEGLSYRKIEKALGCSKSTVAYHLSEGQKERSATRLTRFRAANGLSVKVSTYKQATSPVAPEESHGYPSQRIANKIAGFSEKDTPRANQEFTFHDVVAKHGVDTVCYLSGQPVNLNDPSQYHLDHVQPKSRGGANSLDNLGIATPWANQMKHDMTLDEFLDACEVILKFHDRL